MVAELKGEKDFGRVGGLLNGKIGPSKKACDAPREARRERAAQQRASKPQPHDSDPMEMDTAARLVRKHGHTMRYCAAGAGWYIYDGGRWVPDRTERVRELAKDIARDLRSDAATHDDDRLWKHAARMASANGIDAMLRLARSDVAIAVTPEQFDPDPWLLNCANGTVDLRTGALREHDARDMITRSTNVAFDPRATAEVFERFLREIQPDVAVIDFLRRLIGYAAVGVVQEHVFAVFWGPGANGKSVFVEAMARTLGDYAGPGPASLLIAGRNDSHPTDVASLQGRRLVTVSETRKGAAFDAAKAKLLTGGDTLTARKMRQDFTTFEPTHTLVMVSNYRPQADASDGGLWRRLQVVRFGQTIPEERRDSQLGEKLAAEASGILAWIVRGALEWQQLRLAPPAAVRDETAAYREAEDAFGDFIEERCSKGAMLRGRAKPLYEAYQRWCAATGNTPMRSADFKAELVGRGFARERDKSGWFYKGIDISSDAEADF